MKLAALAILGFFTVAACETRAGDETGRAIDAADTVVTTEQNVDTTIITRDTMVEVDTVRQEGDQPVDRDTVEKSSPIPPPDTGLVDTLQQ